MAKLIDPLAQENPVPRAGFDQARIRVAGGSEERALGLVRAGGDIEDVFGKIDEALVQSRRASQLTDALGKATGDLGDLELAFQRDPEFKTAPQRFVKQSEGIRKKYEGLIDDPVVKGAFNKQYTNLQTAKRLNVVQIAAKQEGDYNVASLDSALDIYATAAANAANTAEKDLVIAEANLAIESMSHGGWISDVDAQKRRKGMLTKIDTATVLRDIQADPAVAAAKLSLAADYVPNIDPVQRERYIDMSLRQSDTRSREIDKQADKDAKARADAVMKQAFMLDADGTLNRDWIEKNKNFVDAREYESMLKMIDPSTREKDNRAAYAVVEQKIYTNPKEAERLALAYHRSGDIKNETLATFLTRARAVAGDEGPKTGYERERAFITNAIKPSEFVPDPAASARYAIVMREFDDYANTGPHTDKDLREKADSLLKNYTMVDMQDLARKTSAGVRNDPQTQLDSLAKQAQKIEEQYVKGVISVQEYNRKIGDLNKARKAAQKALEEHGER